MGLLGSPGLFDGLGTVILDWSLKALELISHILIFPDEEMRPIENVYRSIAELVCGVAELDCLNSLLSKLP